MQTSGDHGRGMARRTLLLGAISSGALLGAAAGPWRTTSAAAAATGSPLFVPPTVDLAGEYRLSAAPATVDLGGQASRAWAYNGTLPGPSLRIAAGDTARIVLENGLTEPTITHWHGMVVDHQNDGHPHTVIDPGASYRYSFPVVQRAAMNWYHPHPHMLTGRQVALGLAGAFIVHDAEESALTLPSGRYEVPLVVRDAVLDASGNLQYSPTAGGFFGNVPLVNGTPQASLDVDTALYRFRVLNGANARIFRLRLNGAAFILIGNDGGLLAAPATGIAELDVAPGERLDLLVDFRRLPVGATVTLWDAQTNWQLVNFRVSRQVSVAGSIPTALSTITPLANPVRTRTFTFNGVGRINGREYDMDRIDFQVPFGDVERWRFTNAGGGGHPVHVHGTSFQVVARSGGRAQVQPWERGWKDTVLVGPRESVDVLIRFDRYRGEYLLHCHNLEHEDMGMMSNLAVV